MIEITDEAAQLIHALVADSDLPDTAGLRLGTDDQTHSLVMDLAAEPHDGDVLVARDGASLFVSPIADARSAGQSLCAQIEGRSAFFVD